MNLQFLILNALRILLSADNDQKKIFKLEILQKNTSFNIYDNDYVYLFDKILEPYKTVKNTFFFFSNGKDSENLASIVLDYCNDYIGSSNLDTAKTYNLNFN
ncbi:MAG TPA: hypothetical protein VHM20_00040 [Gammaproteobacteria bacterium]|nr:hypothetical protein [Gammaproteobacteria bacterium]